MSFVLIFITAAMSQAGANLGPVSEAPRFSTLEQCEQARSRVTGGLSPKTHSTGWQCIPVLPPENSP
jgi:hypothetical protein